MGYLENLDKLPAARACLMLPFVFGKLFWKENWWKAGIIMVGTISSI